MESKLRLTIACLAMLLSGVVAPNTVTAAFDARPLGALDPNYLGLTWFTSGSPPDWYVDTPGTGPNIVQPKSGSNYVRLLAGQTGVITEPSNSGNAIFTIQSLYFACTKAHPADKKHPGVPVACSIDINAYCTAPSAPSSSASQTVKYVPGAGPANMTLDAKPPSCGKPDSYTFKEVSGNKDVLLDNIVIKEYP